MRSFRIALIAVAALVVGAIVVAQSARMPLPGLVALDADNKIVGQIEASEHLYLNLEGFTVRFAVTKYGLRNLIRNYADYVLYEHPGCVGPPYIWPDAENVVVGDVSSGGPFYAIVGPDPTLGTYTVYKASAQPSVSREVKSRWEEGQCVDYSLPGPTLTVVQMVEVLPNPMGGFYGPTDGQPDRTWSVRGGTAIIPPSPTPAPTPTPPAP